jgi:hypothetical protein
MNHLEYQSWEHLNQVYLVFAVGWLRSLVENGPEDPVTQTRQEEWRASAGFDPPPALEILSQRFGLNESERFLLLLCLAMEMDESIPGLYAQVQNDPGCPFPTLRLVTRYLGLAAWQALSPDRPLRHWHLVEIFQPAAQSLSRSPLRLDERILSAMRGSAPFDERLALMVNLQRNPLPEGIELPASQARIAEQIQQRVRFIAEEEPPQDQPAVIQLCGMDSLSKQIIASEVAEKLGLILYHLSSEVLPTHPAEIETLSRLWGREVILTNVALFIEVVESDGSQAGFWHLKLFIRHLLGLVFVDVRQANTDLGRGGSIFDVERPLPKEQQSLWEQALNGESGTQEMLPTRLAGRFNFDAGTICQLASQAIHGQEASFDLEEACRKTARLRMEGLAERLKLRARLDDVVLPASSRQVLEQIQMQARYRLKVYEEWQYRQRLSRGLGITALFSGESGTGKTMAAEAVANELGLDLYRIDLSAVVSKYIGETEKNLRKVFQAAGAGGTILFFDEADALFGKRTEVKDSHDRYANIEVDYLLQCMEEYEGIAILATNLKTALDDAFMRRLRFVVYFPFPGSTDRLKIWRQSFPSWISSNLTDPEWERLANFRLTGGHITNIALNAAFLAASAGEETVHMDRILQAVRSEWTKLELPMNESEFA